MSIPNIYYFSWEAKPKSQGSHVGAQIALLAEFSLCNKRPNVSNCVTNTGNPGQDVLVVDSRTSSALPLVVAPVSLGNLCFSFFLFLFLLLLLVFAWRETLVEFRKPKGGDPVSLTL